MFTFSCGLGTRTIPFVIPGEIFPSNIRSVATGFSSCFFFVCVAILKEIFLYEIEAITLTTALFIFAIINFFGLTVLYLKRKESHCSKLKRLSSPPEGRKLKKWTKIKINFLNHETAIKILNYFLWKHSKLQSQKIRKLSSKSYLT